MKKKNALPGMWMLGIILILLAIVFGTQQVSKYMTMSTASNVSSQNNFFTFLANMFGFGNQSSSSVDSAKRNNNTPNQDGSMSTQGYLPASGGLSPNTLLNGSSSNMISSQEAASFAGQGSNANQEESNADNNSEDSSGTNTDQGTGDLAGSNSEMNADSFSGDNSELSADSNSSSSSDDNSVSDANNNSQNNLGSNSEINSPDTSGGSSGDTSGGSSGSPSGNSPGSNSGSSSQNGLPTLNPIPSDQTAQQNIALQNQQNDALSSILASRQALTAPVAQQAQAAKYQTPVSQDIPTPSTDQPPADVAAKAKSGKLTLH